MGRLNIAQPRFYLDTMLLIDLFTGHEDTRNALQRLLAVVTDLETSPLATSDLAFGEAMVLPMRDNDTHLCDQYSLFWGAGFWEVGKLTSDVILVASFLRARHRGLKMPDALHLASAIRMGCTDFVTGDRRLSGQYGVTASDPLPWQGSVQITRPEIQLFDELIETYR